MSHLFSFALTFLLFFYWLQLSHSQWFGPNGPPNKRDERPPMRPHKPPFMPNNERGKPPMNMRKLPFLPNNEQEQRPIFMQNPQIKFGNDQGKPPLPIRKRGFIPENEQRKPPMPIRKFHFMSGDERVRQPVHIQKPQFMPGNNQPRPPIHMQPPQVILEKERVPRYQNEMKINKTKLELHRNKPNEPEDLDDQDKFDKTPLWRDFVHEKIEKESVTVDHKSNYIPQSKMQNVNFTRPQKRVEYNNVDKKLNENNQVKHNINKNEASATSIELKNKHAEINENNNNREPIETEMQRPARERLSMGTNLPLLTKSKAVANLADKSFNKRDNSITHSHDDTQQLNMLAASSATIETAKNTHAEVKATSNTDSEFNSKTHEKELDISEQMNLITAPNSFLPVCKPDNIKIHLNEKIKCVCGLKCHFTCESEPDKRDSATDLHHSKSDNPNLHKSCRRICSEKICYQSAVHLVYNYQLIGGLCRKWSVCIYKASCEGAKDNGIKYHEVGCRHLMPHNAFGSAIHSASLNVPTYSSNYPRPINFEKYRNPWAEKLSYPHYQYAPPPWYPHYSYPTQMGLQQDLE